MFLVLFATQSYVTANARYNKTQTAKQMREFLALVLEQFGTGTSEKNTIFHKGKFPVSKRKSPPFLPSLLSPDFSPGRIRLLQVS